MAENKKSRKWGRNLKSGQNLIYKQERRHEKSHVRRIRRHIARYGRSQDAADALIRYATAVSLEATRSAQSFLKTA